MTKKQPVKAKDTNDKHAVLLKRKTDRNRIKDRLRKVERRIDQYIYDSTKGEAEEPVSRADPPGRTDGNPEPGGPSVFEHFFP